MEHEGADGSQGAQGSEPRTMRASPGATVATRAECEAAARRIEELALELAVKEAESEDERAALDARRAEELKSAAFRARVEKASKDCLGRETTSTEARCVAQARSELDLDRCSPR